MSVPPESLVTPHSVPWADEAPPADADHTHETACLNCGARLLGPHCHMCGQTRHLHRNLTGFFHDIAHGVFHFEGKIWRTLPLLVWHPGRLTREYISGRRAAYISPIAGFLFATFLMFAMIQFVGSGTEVSGGRPIGQAIDEHVARLAALEHRSGSDTAKEPISALAIDGQDDQDIARQRAIIAKLQKLRSDGLRFAPGDIDLETHISTSVGWLDGMVQHAIADPALLSERVEGNAHKYAWVLIPLSVPFVWLLFAGDRRWKLYDHSVFVTYSITFMMLLATFMLLASSANLDWVTALALCMVPLHIYRQLREAYALGVTGALWRTSVLTVTALLLFAGFSLALLVLGALD